MALWVAVVPAVVSVVNFPDALVLLRVSETGFTATGVVAVYVLYNLVYALVSLPVVALVAVYGGFNGFTDGVGKAWVSTLVDPALRGRAQGVFQGLSGGAVLVAGLWAGLAWESGAGGGSVPLVVAGVVGGLGAVGLALAGRRLG